MNLKESLRCQNKLQSHMTMEPKKYDILYCRYPLRT
jgi:hypothetical protein